MTAPAEHVPSNPKAPHHTQELLERLEGLMADVPALPWIVGKPFRSQFPGNPITPIYASQDGHPPKRNGVASWLVAWLFKGSAVNVAARANLIVESVNALPTLISRIRELEEDNRRLREERQWRPIEAAPKDGSYILAILGPNDSRMIGHLAGRAFAIRHEGKTRSGYDMGWALFPGHGGVPDEWLAGWMPLPDGPAQLRENPAIKVSDGHLNDSAAIRGEAGE